MSLSSDNDTDSTEELDGEYDSQHHSAVDKCIEDEVDTPASVDLVGDVELEKNGEDEDEEDEKEDDEEKGDKDKEENEDEDNGKGHWMIGQGEMVNPLAENVDTMVDDQPIVLPEQGQEICEHTPQPQSPVPAPLPYTPQASPRPQTSETNSLCELDDLGVVTPHKPRLAVHILRRSEAAGNTSDANMDEQLLGELGGGDSLPNVSLSKERPDGWVGEESTCPRISEEAIVVVFSFGSDSCLVYFLCSNLFISGIDNYTRCMVCGLLRVHFIYGFCIGFIIFIVLWDIVHEAFLQLLACKNPPCNGVEDH